MEWDRWHYLHDIGQLQRRLDFPAPNQSAASICCYPRRLLKTRPDQRAQLGAYCSVQGCRLLVGEGQSSCQQLQAVQMSVVAQR